MSRSEEDVDAALHSTRELGFDVFGQLPKAVNSLILLGLLEEAEGVLNKGRALIDSLVAINGRDFLFPESPDSDDEDDADDEAG